MTNVIETNGKKSDKSNRFVGSIVGTMMLKMKDLVVDPRENSRTVLDPKSIDELAEAMKTNGQLQAVRVNKRTDGKYDLIFGYRRHAAATKLGWDELKCDVVSDLTPAARRIQNVTENLSREDLTTYDQAIAFHHLKTEYKLSGSEVGSATGKSHQYVNNLTRIVEGLEPIILARWKEECSASFGYDKDGNKIPNMRRVCDTEWLGKTATNCPRAEQEATLKQVLGLIPDTDEPGNGAEDGNGVKTGSQAGATRRQTTKDMEKAIAAIEKSMADAKGEDLAHMRGVVSGLKWAMGKNQTIKVSNKLLYKTPLPGEKADKETAKA